MENKIKINLEKIIENFKERNFEDNFYIGGGLVGYKFASNRHENARNDNGKMTEGEATQMFKKATKMSTEEVKEIINFAIPNMEWHHAGKLPKEYGGGMKKNYFLNKEQIINLAENWDKHKENKIDFIKDQQIKKKEKEIKSFFQKKYMDENATYCSRKTLSEIFNFSFFYETNLEMQGKHGWFKSDSKYKLENFYTGYQFKTKEQYENYFNIAKTSECLKEFEEIQKNREKTLEFIKQDIDFFYILTEELRANKEIVLEAVKQTGWALKHASEELRGDKEVVIEAVKKTGRALQYATEELLIDKDVVLEAVKEIGEALKYASKELRADKEVVLQAVKENGLSLQYASAELQADKEVVLEAVKEYSLALKYASKELLTDKEFMKEVVSIKIAQEEAQKNHNRQQTKQSL